MKKQFSRRSFLKFGTAAGGVAPAGFDLRAPSWVSQAHAQTPSFEGVPILDGVLLFDEASRKAIAVDRSNLFHRIPAAVLRPGSVQDVVKIVQYANQRSLIGVPLRGRAGRRLSRGADRRGAKMTHEARTPQAIRLI